MKILKYTIIAVFIILISSSCHKRIENNYLTDENMDRKVGEEGGEILFKANYDNDKNNGYEQGNILRMNVPKGALDTTTIFNYYKYSDNVLSNSIREKFDVYTETEFFYVIPNNLKDTASKHLSVSFNEPVEITYYPENYVHYSAPTGGYYGYNRYYLYRIKIPKNNEWTTGDIWMDYNSQGYSNGYSNMHLYYLISGMWSENIEYGEGDFTAINWEPIMEVTSIFTSDNFTFTIDNTDYMYVLVLYMD